MSVDIAIVGCYEDEVNIITDEQNAFNLELTNAIDADPLSPQYPAEAGVDYIGSLLFPNTLEEAPPSGTVIVIGYRIRTGGIGGGSGSGGGGGDPQESEAQAGEPDGISIARRMVVSLTPAQKQKITSALSKLGYSDALIQKLLSQINSSSTLYALLRVGDPYIVPNTNPPIKILTVSQYQNLNVALASLYTPESAQALTFLHNARASGNIIVRGR